jgi:hypothetical protein
MSGGGTIEQAAAKQKDQTEQYPHQRYFSPNTAYWRLASSTLSK